MPLRSKALMKPASSSAQLQHRLERAVEGRVAGAVLEVGDHTDTGSCCDRRHRREPRDRPRTCRRAAPAATTTAGRGSTPLLIAPASGSARRHRRARSSAAHELGGRLEALRRHRGSTQRVTSASSGSGIVGVDRAQRRQPVARSAASARRCALRRRRAGRAAEQHVVEDQAERVDVGALIDRLARACSGAMYSSVPTIAGSSGASVRHRPDGRSIAEVHDRARCRSP